MLSRALVGGTTRDGLADELVRVYGIEHELADPTASSPRLCEEGLLTA